MSGEGKKAKENAEIHSVFGIYGQGSDVQQDKGKEDDTKSHPLAFIQSFLENSIT